MLVRIPFDINMAWFLVQHAVVRCLVTESVYEPRSRGLGDASYGLPLSFVRPPHGRIELYKEGTYKGLLLRAENGGDIIPHMVDNGNFLHFPEQHYFAVWICSAQTSEEIEVTLIHELIHIYFFLVTGDLWGRMGSGRGENEIDALAYEFHRVWKGRPTEAMLRSVSFTGARRKCTIADLKRHFALHPQHLANGYRSKLIYKDGTSQLLTG